jgi:hypothetical protein
MKEIAFDRGNTSICHFHMSIRALLNGAFPIFPPQYGTHYSYVLVVHTLRVAENEILKLYFPAKRH